MADVKLRDYRGRGMAQCLDWALLAFCLVLIGLSVYCFRVSSDAQKVVDAVNGPPLLRVPIDFSEPFTNEFAFRHTVQPFYRTIYLTLRTDPWPKNWTSADNASEELQTADGEMYVISTNNTPSEKRPLNWFYDRPNRSEPEKAPMLSFFGNLPLGDYRLVIATKAGVADVKGSKQELILRYDLIHERSIATVLRRAAIVFVIAAFLSAIAFWYRIRSTRANNSPRSSPTAPESV